jgi:hypothetical protein
MASTLGSTSSLPLLQTSLSRRARERQPGVPASQHLPWHPARAMQPSTRANQTPHNQHARPHSKGSWGPERTPRPLECMLHATTTAAAAGAAMQATCREASAHTAAEHAHATQQQQSRLPAGPPLLGQRVQLPKGSNEGTGAAGAAAATPACCTKPHAARRTHVLCVGLWCARAPQ